MKTTRNLLILIMLFISSLAIAQRDQNQGFDKEKFETARVAFITNRLNLTTDQAEKFWPVFNKFNDDREIIMTKLSDISKESEGNISESEAKNLINKRLELQGELLKLDQKFMSEITKVITNKQALALGGISRDFARHIYRMNQRRRDN
ncbi:hypothetical protein ACFOUP_00175 [Belliella kenyensis]|uniref:LTXXQ motif family protein n=1 Tax=Belliella kenyensis TaxID=1472724 RepID=A0ABV8EH79_9BACT|nr:hypothetical protein [Belliella kenyensis]MCH7401897.1 hypothetical protein [Belliella kenyensis]MDN3604397.1 hypothetical protein [Belliella kenyensis]